MSYEKFRDAIRKTLDNADRSLTWTEIRTTAKLPQALPNNKWVRRMEEDIGLTRERDVHGIIRWSLAKYGSDGLRDQTQAPVRARSRSNRK